MDEPVLVGVDGSPASQRALTWAARYAIGNGREVIAVHVLTYSTEFWTDLSLTGLTAWRQKLDDRLSREWAAPVIAAGVAHREMLIEDDSIDGGLLRIAAEEGAGLIVVGAHGRRDLKDRLLGGVTSKLSQRADRPVVIVPADWNDDLRQRGAPDS